MAEKSFPLENTLYTAADAQLWFATRTSGVYANDHFGVTASGTMNVTLKAGIAWLHYDQFAGCVYANTDNLVLPLEMSDASYDRIDRVCIRLEMLNNKCYAYIKKGAAASSPKAPALQRDNVAYEISIAQIRVGVGVTGINAKNITDERLNSSVCGLMRDGVTGIDTSVMQAQFDAMLQDIYDNNFIRDPGVLRIDETMSLTAAQKENVYDSLGLDDETLGGWKTEVLWENASPSSSFGAQTISVSLSKGDRIRIDISNYTSQECVYDGSTEQTFSIIGCGAWSNKKVYSVASRVVKISAKSIWIDETYYIDSTGAFSTPNDVMVPLRICKIKEVS